MQMHSAACSTESASGEREMSWCVKAEAKPDIMNVRTVYWHQHEGFCLRGIKALVSAQLSESHQKVGEQDHKWLQVTTNTHSSWICQFHFFVHGLVYKIAKFWMLYMVNIVMMEGDIRRSFLMISCRLTNCVSASKLYLKQTHLYI